MESSWHLDGPRIHLKTECHGPLLITLLEVSKPLLEACHELLRDLPNNLWCMFRGTLHTSDDLFPFVPDSIVSDFPAQLDLNQAKTLHHRACARTSARMGSSAVPSDTFIAVSSRQDGRDVVRSASVRALRLQMAWLLALIAHALRLGRAFAGQMSGLSA